MANFKFTPDAKQTSVETTNTGFSFKPDESVNLSGVSGTDLIGDEGFDSKPLSKMQTFLDNITTFKVRKFEGNDRTRAFEKAISDVKEGNFDAGKVASETLKSGARATLSMASNLTGGNIKILGDQLYDYRDPNTLDKIEQYKQKQNNFFAGGLKSLGDMIEKMFNMGIESDLLKPDEEIFKGSFEENPSIARALSAGASVVPSLGMGWGIKALTGSTKLAAVALSGVDAQDIYFGARETGTDKGKALGLYAAGTAGTAVLEKAGLDSVLSSKTASLSRRIFASTLSEGLTEGGQQLYQNTVKKYGYDDTQALWEGVIESIVGGAIGGGAVSVAYGAYEKFANKAAEIGMTPEERDSFIDGVGNEINNNPKAFNAALQENFTKTLNSLNQVIAQNENTDEVKKAMETKQALEEGFNTYFEKLKEFVPEEQAKADAELIRNGSLWMADAYGVSVKEYFDKYAPSIESGEALKNMGAQYQYMGKKAKTADLKKLSEAEKMESEGVDPEIIRRATGWERRPDGDWRFEISDKESKLDLSGAFIDYLEDIKAKGAGKIDQEAIDAINAYEDYARQYKVNYKAIHNIGGAVTTLGKLLKHDKLYKAYPEIADTPVIFENGQYSDEIGGYAATGKDGKKRIFVNVNSNKWAPSTLRGTLMHEIQHIIQDYEGWARGGSSKDFTPERKKEALDKLNASRDELYKAVSKGYLSEIMDDQHMIDEITERSLAARKLVEGVRVFKNMDRNKFSEEAEKYRKFMLEEAGMSAEQFKEYTDTVDKMVPIMMLDEQSSPEFFYASLLGEIEARMTAYRLPYTKKKREEERGDVTMFLNDDLQTKSAIIRRTGAISTAYEYLLDQYKSAQAIKAAKALNQKENQVELNVASFRDVYSREYMDNIMRERGFSTKEIEDVNAMMETVADMVEKISEENGYTDLEDWSKKDVERVYDKIDGYLTPRRNAFIKNGEYPYNIDLGTLCVKRESMDALMNLMVKKGYGQNLGVTQVEALKSMLKDEGFLTACDICFVETKRVRALNDANKWSFEWRAVLDALGLDDGEILGKERELTEEQMNMLDEMIDKDTYKDAYDKYVKEDFKRSYDKFGNELDYGITPDKMQKIAKLMAEDHSLVGRFVPEWLLSTEGVDRLFRDHPQTSLRKTLAAMFGAATSKTLQGFNIYDPLSWRKSFDGKSRKDALEKILAIGGFRAQSFTDFNPTLFFDYYQMFVDLYVRNLPIHIYTKVPSFVELFGETGAMINMSLVPAVDKKAGKKYAGLRKNIDGEWEYAWATESFPVDEAMRLRADKTFGGRVGTIAVGISDEHILKMLDDDTIDMIIPYHASGMSPDVKKKTGLDMATSYENVQNTGKRPKGVPEFNYNEALQKLGDPRKAAKAYLDWCKKGKYRPKFPQFTGHKNYYKLLEDFRGYDVDGNPVIQKPVKPVLPKDWETKYNKAMSERSTQATMIKDLADNKRVMERAEKILEKTKADGEVRDVLVSRLKNALGARNVTSLKQVDFFDRLEVAYRASMKEKDAREKVAVLRKSDGIVYGFAQGAKIILNENVFNANTPAHEFTHIWVRVAQQANPKLWAEGKDLIRNTPEWNEVLNDPYYKEIVGNEDAMASEVLARIVGKLNEDFMRSLVDPNYKLPKAKSIKTKIVEFLKNLWGEVRGIFDKISGRPLTYDEFVRMPLKTLWSETRGRQFNRYVRKNIKEPALTAKQLELMQGWHGTPYRFDKFDLSKSGSGEGAEVHGHGIYIASGKDVGLGYRARLANNKDGYDMLVDGEDINDLYSRIENLASMSRGNEREFQKLSILEDLMMHKTPEEIIDLYSGEDMGDYSYGLEWFKNEVVPNLDFTGGLYEVEIPEESEMINEDLPLSQQPESVQKAVKEIAKKYEGFGLLKKDIAEDATGYDFYRDLGKDVFASQNDQLEGGVYESMELASEVLSKYGVKGIAYDGEEDGKCWVVFDDKDVEIVNRYYEGHQDIQYQSAYAGSRVDYDKPSLEAIGSGEGNQAHGWGLYYALDKDVAERYRKTFVRGKVWKKINSLQRDKNDMKMKDLIKSYYDMIREDTDAEFATFVANKKIRRIKEDLEVENNPEKREKLEAYLGRTKEILSIFSQLTKDDFVGQVHKVNIPEMPELIDEQKSFSEQPENVQRVLKELSEKYEGFGLLSEAIKNNEDGRDLYKAFGKDAFYTKKDLEGGSFETQKMASQELAKNGIKGITYNGREDGLCFVIFDDSDVEVLEKYYQTLDQNNKPRGAYADRVIYLFEDADASTLPHELAHFWSDEIQSIRAPKTEAMMKTIDEWSEGEFNRKYNVIERANGFAVVDKKGLVVYDKNGRGFDSVAGAKKYAREELFAQGFEQYLREGASPNKSLKQAFRNFFMWLKKIYRDAMSLGINLSPDMRNVYADILGGTDIDFFLESDVDTFMKARVALGDDRDKDLDDIISNAIAHKGDKTKDQNRGKGFADIWNKAMVPLSTRAARINPKLRNRLRRYEFELANSLNDRYSEIKPFLEIWSLMNEDDKIAFDLALKNDYVEKQDEIVKKYDAEKQWKAVKAELENIFDEAVAAGIDIGYRPDYFPRKVKDYEGMMSYFKGTDEWTAFQTALNNVDPKNEFTNEEKAEFLNKYLKGTVRVNPASYKYGSEKQRKIDIVDNELNKYYAPSMESLIAYVEGMNARIQNSRFFGGETKNLDESIGGYIAYLLDNNMIDETQVDEVRDILRSRFGEHGVGNRWLANARNLSYMYTMGGVNSAITQIEDLSVAMYKAGVWNALTTVFSDKPIKREDIGVERVAAEFMEAGKTAELLNKLFKITGLDAIDSLGKETLINAEFKKYQQMLEKDPKKLRALIEPIMEEETPMVINDIRNGRISKNVLYLLFSELSDVQPISLSELPAYYNEGGNMRILYMLKSFMIKRIDTFRNESFDKIRSKDRDTRLQGLKNLSMLALLMIMCGTTKDALIDLLYGRDTDLSERVINNMLGLFGISKFHIYKAKEQGFTGMIKEFTIPPIFAFIDDLMTDVFKIANGKRKIKDMEVLKGIPLIGRFYYWHIGRGKEKQRKKKGKY